MESERHLTADELSLARQLRESLAGFLELPSATGVVLPDTRIILANRALERLTGRSREDLLGRKAISLLQAEDSQRARAEVASLSPAASGPHSGTFNLVRPDGQTVRIRTTSIAVRDEAGSLRYIVSRLLPEASIHPSQADAGSELEPQDRGLLDEALAGLPDFWETTTPMAVLRPDGRFLVVNGPYGDLVGYRPDELAGEPATLLAPAENPHGISQRLSELLATGSLPAAQVGLRHRSGSRVTVRGASLLIRDGGGRARFILATVARADPAPHTR